ncbi:hypothetical protein ES703_21087 [subsurface metagenome]
MRIIAYGDIMDGGVSVFTSVAKIDAAKLIVSFGGVIRIDNPYKQLANYLSELEELLSEEKTNAVELDFQDLSFCNSNGFYIIMDIVELIYNDVKGPVVVKRLKGDDWQQETLPILLNTDEPEISERTTFEEFSEL